MIGQLAAYHTNSGFRITPIVALLKPNTSVNADSNEVDEIFYVPIDHFLDDDKHYSIYVEGNNLLQKVHFMPYKHYNIWGATAAIINNLAKQIKAT